MSGAAGPIIPYSCVLSWEQVIVIGIHEYHIPFPDIMASLHSAFSWANLSVFQLFQTGCKVWKQPVFLPVTTRDVVA